MTNNTLIIYKKRNFERLSKDYRQYLKDMANDLNADLETIEPFEEWIIEEFKNVLEER